ncbi:MAG: IS1595 family transposase [Candidatus Binatia bacterium]
MNIIQVFQSFTTQEQGVEYLEKVRWKGRPICPYCGADKVCRHASGDRAGIRWQCQSCTRAFSVTVGTIFHGTHVSLRNWFLVLALMLNAKKSASACQIARDLGMRRATVWSMMHRIRTAMATDQDQSALLYGIVEADECYIGGKPRKPNNHSEYRPYTSRQKLGRGTDKTPVIGVVERNGRVIARPAEPKDIQSKGLAKFIDRHVAKGGTMLVTDEYKGYSRVGAGRIHQTINHSVLYADGIIHTNTIEGFWSLVKRAWYGTHHHYSKKYMRLYIAEACYKYNQRNRELTSFFDTMQAMVYAA